MLKLFLGGGAVLALAYMMADKAKIPTYSREMNRWARPLAIAAVGFALFAFLVYPLLFGDGQPFN